MREKIISLVLLIFSPVGAVFAEEPAGILCIPPMIGALTPGTRSTNLIGKNALSHVHAHVGKAPHEAIF